MAPVDPALLRRWTEAEARLYPVVLVRPELYERYIRLVRGIADELAATVAGIDALAARFESAEDLAREVAGRLGVPEGDMDFTLVAGAAFAHRYREALQDQHRDDARERIRVARERGEAVVMVYETGRRGVPPYRRLEMRLSDGAGIHSFVELDPETGNPVYGLEQIQLDPQTGDWVTDAEALTSRTLFADAQAWAVGVAAAGGSVP
ncbi:MAG: hypothetical protein ACRDKW_06235 [Actinomycetota bacterium]